MVQLVIDNSKSKSSKHAIRTLLYRIDKDAYEEKKFNSKVKPTYSIGEAYLADIPSKGMYIYIMLTKNIYNKVKGKIIVINDGNIVLVLNYRKLKIKKVNGDPKFYEHVKKILDQVKIPVKRVNLK